MTYSCCYRCLDVGKINYEDLTYIYGDDGRSFPVCKSHLKPDDKLVEEKNSL